MKPDNLEIVSIVILGIVALLVILLIYMLSLEKQDKVYQVEREKIVHKKHEDLQEELREKLSEMVEYNDKVIEELERLADYYGVEVHKYEYYDPTDQLDTDDPEEKQVEKEVNKNKYVYDLVEQISEAISKRPNTNKRFVKEVIDRIDNAGAIKASDVKLTEAAGIDIAKLGKTIASQPGSRNKTAWYADLNPGLELSEAPRLVDFTNLNVPRIIGLFSDSQSD
jgi:hypothetical protein